MSDLLQSVISKPCPDFSRLHTVLTRNGIPDYTPFYELYVNNGIMGKILDKKIVDRTSTIEFYYKAGYDYVPAWPILDFISGDLIDTSSDYPINDRVSFEAYAWPKIESIDYSEFESLAPLLPDGMKIIGQTGGIFEIAQSLCGYTGLCYLLHDDRELVRLLFEHLGELYKAMYHGMASNDEVGAIVISDDLGFKTQTMLSTKDIREFILPWHTELAQIAHSYNKPCILHSCGNLREIMDDIIDNVKIDAKHSYENTIMPVIEAKKLYGDKIAILGGIDVDFLCRSSKEQIQNEVNTTINMCGSSGGYALGSGNSIADYVPVENYLTMIETGWKLRNR